MKTRIFTLIISLLVTTITFAYDIEIDGIYYNLDMENKTAEVTSRISEETGVCDYTGDIVIPSFFVNGGVTYSVTSISNCAFFAADITSITIPNSVTEVGGGVFGNCSNLKSVVLSENMTSLPYINDGGSGWGIDYGFFHGCISLESIIIPNGIVEIGNLAFNGCESLVSIEIPNSVTEIGGGLFASCKSLKTVKLPENIKVLRAHQGYQYTGFFQGCESLESFTIPNSVTEISEKAFYGCSSLTSIEIPNSVTKIGRSAFSDCSSLTSITIPNSVTEIGDEAFSGCIGLTSIEIPNSVIYLGDEAFANCPALRYVKLGNGFRTNNYEDADEPYSYLGANLFYFEEGYYYINEDTENEEYVWLSSPLDTLICEFIDCDLGESGGVGFDDDGILQNPLNTTKNLRYFQGPAKLVNTISEETQTQFSNKLTEVHITDGELDENGFNYINRSKKSLHTIDLAGTTNTTINDLAFYDCYKLEKLMLPANLETIGFKAVAECLNLKSMTIPASVVEIADAAFYNCHSITSVSFAEDGALRKIGSWAFHNNYALKSLEIPEGVEEIGDATFYGCAYLEDITLPSTVQNIGDNSFALCNKVKRMEVKAVIPPTIEAKTFLDVNRNIPVIVPEGTCDAYANDEYWGEFVNVVESDEDTSIENAENATIAIYSIGGVLYVDGLSADYQLFDINGRLIYTGCDAQLQLPRGVYMIAIGGEVQKVVL